MFTSGVNLHITPYACPPSFLASVADINPSGDTEEFQPVVLIEFISLDNGFIC